MLAFLGHRGVIDDQYRIAAADKPIRLNEQFPLQRRQIPDTTSNKVMQLIIVVRRKTFRHWLNALAITGPDQPRNVKRTHPPPCLVTQALSRNGSSQPLSSASQFNVVFAMVGPSTSRPPMNH